MSTEPIHLEVPDAHGGFFVVWGDSVAASGARLLGKHFDAHGQSIGNFAETLLVPQIESVQDWSAFPDGWGGLALVWVAGGRLSVRRYGDSLEPVIHETILSRQSPKRPTGVEGGGGALDLAWAEEQSENRRVLKAQRIDADGRIVWAEGGVPFSLNASLKTRSTVQPDNTGGLLMAWYDDNEAKDQSRLRIQRLSIAGQPLWGPRGITVAAPVYDFTSKPAMEPLGEGRIVMGWDAPQANAMSFFTEAFELSGAPMDNAPPRAVSALPTDKGDALLAGDDSGNVWVAWSDFRNGHDWTVFIKKLPPTGEALWRKPATLSDYAEDQRFPAMASDSREGIFGVWVGNRLGKVSVYAQHLNDDGAAQWGTYGRLVADTRRGRRPHLKALAEGHALVVWTDEVKSGVWTLNAAFLDAGD
jgi:hypothetical protein